MDATTSVETLWQERFFKEGRSLSEVAVQINKKWGHNFSASSISHALSRSSRLRKIGKHGSYHYIQKTSPVSKKIATAEEELFSQELISKLGKDFETEIRDLRLNFGNSGTCTAFLLRKILEKLIYIVSMKNGFGHKIQDKTSHKLVGLEKMLDIVSQEKVSGISVVTPHTAQKIKGIKFLGDTSAHNPLVNVDMETIILQMPFITTAYKELAVRL